MMRTVFIILAILLAVAVFAVAMLNQEIITLNYLFGQVELALFTLIVGSALAGVLLMIFFNIYRSIHNYIKAEGERSFKKELQRRVKILEGEKSELAEELRKLQKERESADEKVLAETEAEKRKLEDELNKQQQEREDAAAKEQAELEAEKDNLEEKLKKEQVERNRLEAQPEIEGPEKKGFWDFFKRNN